MATATLPAEFYARFKVFHELMTNKIREILLVSSPYDAYVMEEDGRLASRIINEYHGLNLSQPPRVTRTSSAYAALEHLNEKKFDMVITTPHLEEMDAYSLGRAIKKVKPDLPVILSGSIPERALATARGQERPGDRQGLHLVRSS